MKTRYEKYIRVDKIGNLYKKASSAILRTSHGINIDFYEKMNNGSVERIETMPVSQEQYKDIKSFFKKNICDNKKDIDKIIGWLE